MSTFNKRQFVNGIGYITLKNDNKNSIGTIYSILQLNDDFIGQIQFNIYIKNNFLNSSNWKNIKCYFKRDMKNKIYNDKMIMFDKFNDKLKNKNIPKLKLNNNNKINNNNLPINNYMPITGGIHSNFSQMC